MADAEHVARGVYKLRTLMVNVFFVADSDARDAAWVLVDTGIRGYAATIKRTAGQLFDRPPSAILLTHGHFDHVGGLPPLADEWQAPVYAHPLELPYVTGRSSYPPPDPAVGGGLLARFARLYPRGPIDLGARVRALPERGTVPVVPEWQWIATPGHTPGHVSFFRESDRTLIAGDAVVTTHQESVGWVATQRESVSRPPAYYTQDWNAARTSVQALASLEPNVLATGHGYVMSGESMRVALRDLANNFDLAMPSRGRYVPFPAVADDTGTVQIPPPVPAKPLTKAALLAGTAAAGFAIIAVARRRA